MSVSVHPDGITDIMSQRHSPIPQPPTTVYPDLMSPPYSVTTFNQPPHSEPHLLTPVSDTGSPSFQQRAKIMQQHHSTVTSMYQSSPPSSSEMLWGNSYNVGASYSQAASPLAMNTPTTKSHFEMSYLPADRSGEDEIPEPPVPYFGTFGVSGQQEQEQGSLSPPMQPGFYMPSGGLMLSQTSLMATNELTMGHRSMGRPLAPSTQAPYHMQPHTDGYQLQTEGVPDQDEATRKQRYSLAFPSAQISRPGPIPASQGRVKKGNRKRGRPNDNAIDHETLASTQSYQDLPDELIIRPDCPDEDRFILTRWRQLKDQNAKGIWATITAEHNQKFPNASRHERLQMKLRRCRILTAEMSPKDKAILKEAISFYDDKQYWKLVHRRFKDNNGGQTVPWGALELEQHAVQWGFAAMSYEALPGNPAVTVRRRRKLNLRRESAANDDPSFQAEPMTYEQRVRLQEDILAHRGTCSDGDDDDDEEMVEEEVRAEMDCMRLAQGRMEMNCSSVIQAEGDDKGCIAGPSRAAPRGTGRAAANNLQQKPLLKGKGKARVSKSRAA